jgi:hypothetical protein
MAPRDAPPVVGVEVEPQEEALLPGRHLPERGQALGDLGGPVGRDEEWRAPEGVLRPLAW